MRPHPSLLPCSAASRALPALLALAGAALLPSAARAQDALASAVPVPQPAALATLTPSAATSAFRVADVGADGRERGWLSADVRQGAAGLAITVSRSALRMSSPNARILGVRAVLVDADTSRGWRVRAASTPVKAASLIGCVDGQLARPVSLVIPAGPEALRGTRLAFELVGQVRAPGSSRWDQVAERWLPGPVLAAR